MEAGKQVKKLPMTLGDALEALKKDEVIKCGDAGRDVPPLRRYKRDEWERFLHTVDRMGPEDLSDCLP